MVAGFTFFNLFVRWYEEVYGWSAGLDAFAPEFKTNWMNWLYIESVTCIVLFCFIGASLWKTRTRDMDALTSREVLERHFYHLVWLVAYGIAIFWAIGFHTEQDGTWHQTVIRDKDFTPSHIIRFYMSYPIYILTGWGAFMYARTRIPCFSKGVSLPYLIVVVGPFMILPNVGLNAEGHTFWWTEELFVAPLHYGFVFFGWMALGVCGLLCQICDDIGGLLEPPLKQELIKQQVTGTKTDGSTTHRSTWYEILIVYSIAYLVVPLLYLFIVLWPLYWLLYWLLYWFLFLFPPSSLGFLLCSSVGALGIVLSLSRLLSASRVTQLVLVWASSLLIALSIPLYNFFGFEDPIVRAPYNLLAWILLGISVVISYRVATAQAAGRSAKRARRRELQTKAAPLESPGPDDSDDPDKRPLVKWKKWLFISRLFMSMVVIIIALVVLTRYFVTSRVQENLHQKLQELDKDGRTGLDDLVRKWRNCQLSDNPIAYNDGGSHGTSSRVICVAERNPSPDELIPQLQTRPCYNGSINHYKSGGGHWYDGFFDSYTEAVNLSTIWLQEDVIKPVAIWKVIKMSSASESPQQKSKDGGEAYELLTDGVEANQIWQATCTFDSQAKQCEIDFKKLGGTGPGNTGEAMKSFEYRSSKHKFEALTTLTRVEGKDKAMEATTGFKAYEYPGRQWDIGYDKTRGLYLDTRPAYGEPELTYNAPGPGKVLYFQCKPVTQSKQ